MITVKGFIMENNEKLCNRLISLRNELGLTQVGFATMLNISRNAIVLYEKGDRFPTVEVLERLHHKTGVDLNWLITGSKPIEQSAEFSPQERLIIQLTRNQSDYFQDYLLKMLQELK